MTKISELTNKKLNICRYLSYWLYVLCTIGIPICLVSWQCQIFKKPGGTQLTAYGVILVIMLLFIFRGHLKQAIAEMEKGIAKTIIINIGKLIPWIVFWFILTFLSNTLTIVVKLKFILFWTIIGNILAMFLDIWHTALCQECKHREG